MVLNINQHLGAAPITEAIVDIRLKELTGWEVETFSDMPKSFLESYKASQELKQQAFNIEVGLEGKADGTAVEVIGKKYEAIDGKRVVQFRKDGFTLSFLRPYTSWEELQAEAKKLFNVYKSKIASESSITRIAVRYINHIDVPSPCDLQDYLTSPPSVPKELSQQLTGFLTQNTINIAKFGAIARIVQSSAEGGDRDLNTNKPSILLDIDVIKFMDPQLELEDDSLWSHFEDLRQIKNDIFYSSITEKTVELFK